MPTIDPANLELFAKFIVPGFVAVKVWDLIVPTTRRDFSKMIVELIAYSLLLMPLVEGSRKVMVKEAWQDPFPVGYALAVLASIALPSAVVTVLFYLLRRLLAVAFKIASPIPTGYDFAFCQKGPFWLYFHLKDGRIFAGSFDSGASAGSGISSREIYVRNPGFIDENGQYQGELDAGKFALVKFEDCNLIEFHQEEG